MKTINLTKYAPTITNPDIAKQVYNLIINENPREDIITIELGNIVTMTTRCAKIIFGFLYIDLGADLFYQNILLKDCSDGLQLIIEYGIEHALASGKNED